MLATNDNFCHSLASIDQVSEPMSIQGGHTTLQWQSVIITIPI